MSNNSTTEAKFTRAAKFTRVFGGRRATLIHGMMTHDDLGHEGRKDLSEIFRAKGAFSAYYMRDARLAQAKLTEKRRRQANWRNYSSAIDRGRHQAGAPGRTANACGR